MILIYSCGGNKGHHKSYSENITEYVNDEKYLVMIENKYANPFVRLIYYYFKLYTLILKMNPKKVLLVTLDRNILLLPLFVFFV